MARVLLLQRIDWSGSPSGYSGGAKNHTFNGGSMNRAFALALGLVLALAPGAFAQQATGNIYGTVSDESGAVLPGALVTLSGSFGTQTTTSDFSGEFRFLRVDHGTHTITATLSGFAGVSREVVVNVGRNVTLSFSLKVASVEEILTVTAETPVVDTKNFGTETNITKDELSKLPSSRDPWALMRTVPGVVVDRVNLAGSESGQQSSFFGKGADPKDAVWSLDGITITDEVSMSSPTYYTYDMFDEVQFSTGSNDISQSSGGMGISFATKRGTNQFHGGAGGYFTHDDLQSSNLPDELVGDSRLQGSDKADHTEQISDYSFDLGGPIVKDKLWFYGSYGRNDIRIRNLVQNRDKTVLENYSGKLNWQASPSDMVSVFWFNGAKTKIGRAASALQENPSHTRDQGNAYKGGPDGLSKIEWNHIFGPSFFLNVKGAYYNTGFTLTPQGGLDTREIIDNVASEARGSSADFTFLRPQYTAAADGSYFASAWGGNHEVKFGVSFRRNGQETIRTQPGDKVQVRFEANGQNAARFYRDAVTKAESDRWSVYLGDTFSKDRLTINASLRFDSLTASSKASESEANPAISTVMPGLPYAGTPSGQEITWNNFQPRVGLTYALDESRKTVLRASYSRYAGLLPVGNANWDSPVVTSFLTYGWSDANGDSDVQLGEVDFDNLIGSANIDPTNPTAASSPNLIDPDFGANTDDEVVVGIERELIPDLAFSAAYTWRKSTNLTSTQLWSGTYWYNWFDASGTPFSASDYVAQAPVTANGFTATSYAPSAAANAAFTGGALLGNRKDLSRQFNGVELALAKRLSNRWMGRVAFSYNDWTENVGPGAINNPTRHDWDPLDDGGQVVIRSAGSGKIFYSNAKWQLNVNGLVQLGYGFELAGNVFARQGYPNPVYLSLSSGFDGTLRVLPDGFAMDDQRFDSLVNVDLRLAKNLELGGANVILSAEAFNLFNSNTDLKRLNQANSSSYLRLDEILAPRIIRFGARFTF
jgi:hypothetical protein